MSPRPEAPTGGDGFNLADFCLKPGAPDDPALAIVNAKGEARTASRSDLRGAVDQIAQVLTAHMAPGARVALQMRNSASMATAYFATVRAGLVALPLSPQLARPEIAQLLTDSTADLIVADNEADPHLQDHGVMVTTPKTLADSGDGARLRQTGADDPAFLIYTSGTGGRPKGVLHAQRSVLGRVPMRDGWLGIGPGDRTLHAGSLNWTYTLGVGLIDPLAAGATAVLAAEAPNAADWPRLIVEQGITVFAAVPSIYRRILKYGDPSLLRGGVFRHGVCAGEPLPPELWRAWTEATGKPFFEALGMTEISTYISSGPHTPTRPGSPGRPQPGRRIAILDQAPPHAPLPVGVTGLLAVHRSDPGLMLGYWQRPEEEASVFKGEWFVGGDLASEDADGYIHFGGRADDVMNAFGVRTSPLEIENVLLAHPAVEDIAVTTTQSAEGLALVTAFVVPRDAIDRADLVAWAGERIAAYKIPKRFIAVDSLPRTANGKVQRRRLADLLGADGAREL